MTTIVIVWLFGAVVWASVASVVTNAKTCAGLLAVSVAAALAWPLWVVLIVARLVAHGGRRGR